MNLLQVVIFNDFHAGYINVDCMLQQLKLSRLCHGIFTYSIPTGNNRKNWHGKRKIEPGKITISASTDKGLFYEAVTLKQLIKQFNEQGYRCSKKFN